MKTGWMLTGAALLLAGCSGGGSSTRAFETAPPATSTEVADYPVKIGEPYELDGVTYTPSDAYNYDETGYASWYGKELVGRNTANGELFNADAISGAHRTLPLPSYAEVTSLESGKTILVRLNDRGPSSRDRLIDLSYGAAMQLGVADKGVFAVRVRRVNPPEAERAMLRQGQAVAMRMETPESLLVPLRRRMEGMARPVSPVAAAVAPAAASPAAKPDKPKPAPKVAKAPNPAPKAAPAPKSQPVPTAGADRFIVEGQGTRPRMAENSAGETRTTQQPTAPAPRPAATATGSYFVQVAAFGSKARADDLAQKIGARTVASDDGKLFRVRYGPYADAKAAEQGLTLARRNGYQGVRIQKDTGRP